FRSLDPFRALRGPDCRRRDEKRPFPLRTKNSQHNPKQPLDRKSPIQVHCELDLRGRDRPAQRHDRRSVPPALKLCAKLRRAMVKHRGREDTAERVCRGETRSYAAALSVLVVAEWLYLDWASRAPQRLPVNFVHAEWITLHDNPGFRGFVDFLRAELDRIGPAQEDLCRDFFQRAVALELSFFEAAYPDRT